VAFLSVEVLGSENRIIRKLFLPLQLHNKVLHSSAEV